MPKRTANPADFTVSQLKAMLAAKTKIDELTVQREALARDLAKVEKELAGLLGGNVPAAAATGKKAGRKKVARKKTAKTSPNVNSRLKVATGFRAIGSHFRLPFRLCSCPFV